MIWVAGRLVDDSALVIPATDRAFEHGLGLFETLRTWNREAVLLPRHLARLARSARALGVPLDPAALPTPAAVQALLNAQGINGDAVLRITLSGGQSESGGSVVWMRVRPLAPEAQAGAVAFGFWTVAQDDPLARHKSLNYWRRRLAFEQAQDLGGDELLARTPDGLVWEGSRANLFAVFGTRVETPPLEGPIVPGVMRAVVLQAAARLGVEVVEQPLREESLAQADEVFLTNSGRGVMPVRRFQTIEPAAAQARDWAAPGSWTEKIRAEVRAVLSRGGPV